MTRLFVVIIISVCTTALAVSPTLESFNGGQVGWSMESRVTFPRYSSSLRTLENMFAMAQGPVRRRPGTKYIASQRSSSAAGRIIGFERSAEESYILLFEDQFLRFFTNGGQVLDSTGVEDISALDNIVGHWLLNEQTGSSVVDDDGGTHTGTLKDSADTSIDTSVVNVTGKVNGAFDLDTQYTVQFADAATLSFTDNNDDEPFSMASWIYVEANGESQTILSKWREGGSVSEYKFSLTDNLKLKTELSDSTVALSATTIAQWKLNDDAASTAVDDAVASIPHDGVASANTNTLTATGQIDKALDFSATAFVTVTDHAQLSFGDASTDSAMSISAWVFVTNSAVTQMILSKWDSGGTEEWYLYLNLSEQVVFGIYDKSLNKGVWQRTTGSLNAGWRHVVISYSGYSGTGSPEDFMTIYVDNVAVAMTTDQSDATYVAMEDGGDNVLIGSYFVSGTESSSFADKLDNVMLFSGALTAGDVGVLYNSGSGTETVAAAEVSNSTDDALSIGWHHVASTYSAPDLAGAGGIETTAADGIIFYVDGAAVSSTAINSATYTSMQDSTELLRIGAQRNSANTASEKFFAEKVDSVNMFSDVLTPAEVATLFSTTPMEIATPYLTADLPDLNFTKNDDVVFIAHPNYKPRQLSRTGIDLWTLVEVDFQTGPFLPENDTATTLSSDGLTGSVTLTASTNIFKTTEGASHIGSIWQFNQVGGSPSITGTFAANGISIATAEFQGGYSFTTSGTWTGNIVLQRSTNDGVSWRNALVPLAADTNYDNPGEIEEDGATYRAVMSNYGSGTATYNITVHDESNRGVVRITGVASGTSATATVLNDLVSTSATTQWREGYWSDFRGWPKSGAVHQQRLVFGGSDSFPQTIWFGRQDPDEYENFLEGTLDTSAFTVALEGQNQVRWLLSQDYMLIGTSGSIGKWGEQGQAVNVKSPNYQEQTRHGSAAIQAGLGGDSVLYIERGSRKVRQFSFDLQVDKYLSPDVTILSPEITEGGIVEIAFQLRPDPILWCVLGDGNMATLTYQRDQSIAAWAKQLTDGDFKSVAVIPGQSGTNEDEVWVIAERTINSTQVFYVEQFQPQEWGSDDNDAYFVDAGISYSGVATDTFTGAGHLEAETVSIYADKLIESPEVVVSGGFTIDNAAARVLVGMVYTSKLETLPLVIDPQDRAKDKKVKSIWLDVYKTGAFKYGNGASSTLTNFNFKNNLDLDNTVTAQDLTVGPATSIVKPLLCRWVYGSMKKQTIFIQSSQPMPLTLRSITASYNFYGD